MSNELGGVPDASWWPLTGATAAMPSETTIVVLLCGIAATTLLAVLIRRRPALRRARTLLWSAIAACALTDAADVWAIGHPAGGVTDALRVLIAVALLTVVAALTAATPNIRVARSLTPGAGTIAQWTDSRGGKRRIPVTVETLEALGDLLLVRSGDGRLTYVSPGWQSLRETAAEAAAVDDWRSILHPEDAAEFDAHEWSAHAFPERTQHYHVRVRADDGSYRSFAARTVPLTDPRQPGSRLYAFAATDSHHAQPLPLPPLESRLTLPFAHAAPLVWIVDDSLNVQFGNDDWRTYTGLELGSSAAAKTLAFIHPDDLATVNAAHVLLRAARPAECELRLRRADGTFRWHALRIAPLACAEESAVRWLATATDIDARKAIETGSGRDEAGSRELLEALTPLIAQAGRDGNRVALMYVDIDHFTRVNDNFGHGAGDDLLRDVGARIAGALRGCDVASRFGGDEFIAVCPAEDAASAAGIVGRMHAMLQQPVEIGGRLVAVSASIGVSMFPDDGDTPSDLIAKADAAMHRAKARGRNTWCFYGAPAPEPPAAPQALQDELRAAIAANQFLVYYQPIAEIASARTIGAEALVRWQHPTRGVLLPDDFIPLAERYRLVAPIGELVLDAACAMIATMTLRSSDTFSIAVNISAQHFVRTGFVESVARIIERHGIEPRRLEIEITESVLIADTGAVVTAIEQLRGRGVQVGIDDFGTGYSSLSSVKNFAVHTLKIDRSFVRDVALKFTDEAIAQTIVALAHGLGMRAIAEGVETAAQFERLHSIGADCAQGYFISRPLPPAEFECFMAGRRSTAGPLMMAR